MTTYSIAAIAYGPGQATLVTIGDDVADGAPSVASASTTPPGKVNLVGTPNWLQDEMRQQTTFFPKLADGSTGTPYVIDNERSDPSRGLIYTRPLLP